MTDDGYVGEALAANHETGEEDALDPDKIEATVNLLADLAGRRGPAAWQRSPKQRLTGTGSP